MASTLTVAQAEAHLRSLEPFGMRFGLHKMRRMMSILDSPERRFDSIHIVGTNGKTSTARMTAAILARHGLSTGTYTSPHLQSYRERLQVEERDLEGEELAAAVAAAEAAAELVDRALTDGDRVTQFELLTAAGLWELARREVAVAVIEAGLGGRYDATSVIDSPLTVLTNIGLEHTRWLGTTLEQIAEEKLAVVRPGGTLVHGEDLAPAARAVAERVAEELGARVLIAGGDDSEVPPLRARGGFQRRNFALARVAARVHLEGVGRQLSAEAVAEAAGSTVVAGRLEVVAEDPLTVLDAAHNPHAIAALVPSLGEILGERPVALVMGVLEDKDSPAMLEMLGEVCERAWFTAPASPRACPPQALAALARELGFEDPVCEPLPARALAEAQRWARRHGGAVLATGSVYLIGDLLESTPGLHALATSSCP